MKKGDFMMACDLNKVISAFNISRAAEIYGNGHINDTYLVNHTKKYILQKINTNIFKRPEQLMAVTDFIKKKVIAAGGDPERETLTVIRTVEGKNYYKAEDGSYFRMYNFVENAVSYDAIENPIQFYHAAKAFGRFQQMLSDFPVEILDETIPNFHNTRSRFSDFLAAVEADKVSRAVGIKSEIQFVLDREKYADVVNDAIKDGSVPVRVTHNDTKLNNVLLDVNTNEGVCVIDLDTVMPGSALYDFGDALRFGANHGAEDDKNLENVYCDLDLFEQFTKGFLEEVGESLTEKEIELLPFSAILMTYECGMRFLGDYLNGDVYFKIHYPEHNLDRARSQFKLVADMESKSDEMASIVRKYRK